MDSAPWSLANSTSRPLKNSIRTLARCGDLLGQHLLTLLQGEQRRGLLRVADHRDDHVVEMARGPLDDVEMTVGDGIERARAEGGGHAAGAPGVRTAGRTSGDRDHQERIAVGALLLGTPPVREGQRLPFPRSLHHHGGARGDGAPAASAASAADDLRGGRVVRRVEEHEVERRLGNRRGRGTRRPSTVGTARRRRTRRSAGWRGSRPPRRGHGRRARPSQAPRDNASIAERATPRVEVEHVGIVDAVTPERREQRLLQPVGGRTRRALRRDQPSTARAPGDHAQAHQLFNGTSSGSALTRTIACDRICDPHNRSPAQVDQCNRAAGSRRGGDEAPRAAGGRHHFRR